MKDKIIEKLMQRYLFIELQNKLKLRYSSSNIILKFKKSDSKKYYDVYYNRTTVPYKKYIKLDAFIPTTFMSDKFNEKYLFAIERIDKEIQKQEKIRLLHI